MESLRELKLAQKSAAMQQQLLVDLEGLVKDLERSDKVIADLKNELIAVNEKHPSPRTTRQDIDYLTDLLRCANKKLVWEKQLSSLQKRAPELMDRMLRIVDDPANPAPESVRNQILKLLQNVQAGMERLKKTQAA
jgi:hypothetical protein